MGKTLHPEKLEEFWSSGKLLTFKRKDVIMANNLESTQSYYWIKKGYVKVCSYAKSGSERIHYIYGPGDIFPIGWLLTGSAQWVTFIALDEIQLIEKNLNSFKEFIAHEPFILAEIIRMNRNSHDRIYGLNLDSPIERMAHALLMLAVRFGEKNGEHIQIAVPLSQQEFADMVKMSRETAGKVLNELENKGFLILGRKRILIDFPKLESMLEQDVD